MRRSCAAAVLTWLMCSACAPFHSGAFVDRDVNFSTYRTYTWTAAPPQADDAASASGAALAADTELRDRVMGEVERQLAARGLRGPSQKRPDLLIRYRAAVTPRLQVSTSGAPNAAPYGNCSYDCFTRVDEYETATLVLDVIDARTRKLIWRGWTRDDLKEFADSDQSAERLRKAIDDMMTKFPADERSGGRS